MSQLEFMSISEKESPENQSEITSQQHALSENLMLSHEEMHMPETDKNAENHSNSLEKPLVEEDPSRNSAHHQHFEKFLKELEKQADSEAKLQFAVDFMEASLAQSGTPHFKSFWEARSICLQLFKENISPALRATLWTKYNELSKEARRLKEILDEQSAFAVEQIEIAVKALESDIASFEEQIQKIQPGDFGMQSQALANRLPHYQQLQGKLNLLNTHAARINALRKELIRTEMRVRQKNKFFQRLSAAGDKVFPQRKELIKEVSDSFIADIDAFIGKYFTDNDFHNSLFSLREEIKALQNMAKVLTLNTHSFTHTRMRLSECWQRHQGRRERTQKRARAAKGCLQTKL